MNFTQIKGANKVELIPDTSKKSKFYGISYLSLKSETLVNPLSNLSENEFFCLTGLQLSYQNISEDS